MINFHISKLRESVSHLKPLINIADEIMNKNTLSDLNPVHLYNYLKIILMME